MISAVTDWDGLLVNLQATRRGNEFSWSNSTSSFIPQPVTAASVRELFRERQYSFCATDGSLFQLGYRFDRSGDALTHAALSFLASSTQAGRDEEDEESALAEVEGFLTPLSGAPGGDDDLVPWLRLDYAPAAERRDLLHHDCHLHLAGFSDLRLPATGVPSPRQFVEMVVAAWYPDEYRKHRLPQGAIGLSNNLAASINEHVVPVQCGVLRTQVIHLGVPGC
ncbi:MAG: DUF2290 domain-containing protein [Deltaproteobacteria bacterium]